MSFRKHFWKPQRGHKYNAQSTYYDGIKFDSKFECKYYQDLLWKQKAGEIAKIEVHYKLELKVNGIKICNYAIDFRVTNSDGSVTYIETKGVETYDWRIKWNLFMALLPEIDPGAEAMVVKESQSKKFAPRK